MLHKNEEPKGKIILTLLVHYDRAKIHMSMP